MTTEKLQTVPQRINDLLHIDFNIDSNPEFWQFLILWNLFECRLFGTSFSIDKAIVNNYKASDDVLRETFLYFQSRYVETGNTNQKFDGLNFRKNDKKENISRVLCEGKDTELNPDTAIQCIIYRLRNNLFHGLKSIEEFSQQNDMFNIVNKYLLSCQENNIVSK